MLSGALQFLSRFLPDRCQQIGCTRRGVRGKENVVVIGDQRRMMCEECTQIHIHRRRARADYAAILDRAIDALNKEGEQP